MDHYAVTVYHTDNRASYSLINAKTDHLGYVGIAALLSNVPHVSRVYLIDRDDCRIMRLYSKGNRIA